MNKITPFLWFDHQAEAAAKFYTAIFKKSKILKTTHYDESTATVSGRKAGSVMTVEFELNGQKFVALNGGPQFRFNEAVSFVVNCRDQKEVDHFWKKLSAGGKKIHCGWLRDKFGVSWQVVPEILGDLVSGRDVAASHRVMQTLLKMEKLDIKKLKKAYAGTN
jgi:predicted 3-demethylubiquinone-9 3-methyltransferase (glyoxalase superfamily)